MTPLRPPEVPDWPLLSDIATPVGVVTGVLDPEPEGEADADAAACIGVKSANVIVPWPVCWRILAEADDPGLSVPNAQIKLVELDVESKLDGMVKEILVDEVLEKDWARSRDAARGGLEITAHISSRSGLGGCSED
jgi:hypothetical protein